LDASRRGKAKHAKVRQGISIARLQHTQLAANPVADTATIGLRFNGGRLDSARHPRWRLPLSPTPTKRWRGRSILDIQRQSNAGHADEPASGKSSGARKSSGTAF